MVKLFGAKKKRLRGKVALWYVRANLNLNCDFVANFKLNIAFRLEKIR